MIGHLVKDARLVTDVRKGNEVRMGSLDVHIRPLPSSYALIKQLPSEYKLNHSPHGRAHSYSFREICSLCP